LREISDFWWKMIAVGGPKVVVSKYFLRYLKERNYGNFLIKIIVLATKITKKVRPPPFRIIFHCIYDYLSLILNLTLPLQ